MARKLTITVGVILIVLGAIGLWAMSQQKAVELPPGVLAEMWVPINDTAGVALNFRQPRLGASEPGPRGLPVYGTLMVKSHGIWQKVYLNAGSDGGRFLPVH